ncbi:MAG: DUF424 family protein [Nanoarchaeota archaeon]
MIVKLHKKDDKILVAACDEELLGQKFEEDGKQIDLTGEFFNGEKMDHEEAGDLIRNADIVNLVGKKTVNLGLEEGVIEQENVILIAGVPTAQAVISHS